MELHIVSRRSSEKKEGNLNCECRRGDIKNRFPGESAGIGKLRCGGFRTISLSGFSARRQLRLPSLCAQAYLKLLSMFPQRLERAQAMSVIPARQTYFNFIQI
jgi:hypothetical protein